VFTLVICLVVVALSGAVVLHITLADQTKRATAKPRRPPDPSDRTVPAGAHGPEPRAAPATLPEVHPEVAATTIPEIPQEPEVQRSAAPAPPGRAPSTPSVVIDVHRARSAGLLVLLLTVLGGVLALAVAAAAVAAAVALRSALIG
jgi:hypothetical protein